MLFVIAFIFLGYVILMIFLLSGWNKVVSSSSPGNLTQEMITVLIPARNEKENIAQILGDLQRQRDTSFEVIVIDDHSEDDTYRKVMEIIRNGFDNLKIIKLKETLGKKSALTLGVKEAKGSLIVTTDADCRVDERWLSSFRKCFSDSSVKLAFGGVRIYQDEKLWLSMQAIELASMIGSGAATLALGFPTMCNGANLAYRKEAFKAVGGYSGNEHIPSGDDDFLLKKINAKFPVSIRFVANPENIVETSGVSFSSLVHQRIRWAGKWKSIKDVGTKLMALFIFAFHFSYLLTVMFSVIQYNFILLLAVSTLKLFLELIFLRKVMLFLNSRWNWRAFLILQLVYSFYVIAVGILANLKSPVWKGRKIRQVDLEINPVLRQNH